MCIITAIECEVCNDPIIAVEPREEKVVVTILCFRCLTLLTYSIDELAKLNKVRCGNMKCRNVVITTHRKSDEVIITLECSSCPNISSFSLDGLQRSVGLRSDYDCIDQAEIVYQISHLVY